jgi:hypothetical protein
MKIEEKCEIGNCDRSDLTFSIGIFQLAMLVAMDGG